MYKSNGVYLHSINSKKPVLFLDTKPLVQYLLYKLSVGKDKFSPEVYMFFRYVDMFFNDNRLYTTCYVITETLYFVYKEMERMYDYDRLFSVLKNVLKRIKEYYVTFEDIVKDLSGAFPPADTSLIIVAKDVPEAIIVSTDRRLVETIRIMCKKVSRKPSAYTMYELIQLRGLV